MSSVTPAPAPLRARFSATALALVLLSLWVQILQPLAHTALLRALLDGAPDGYSIICTRDGPQLVSSTAAQEDTRHHESNPLASTQRPMGDCCMGVVTPVPLPGLALLAIVLVRITEPAPLPLHATDAAAPSLAWRPAQPRAPPLFV